MFFLSTIPHHRVWSQMFLLEPDMVANIRRNRHPTYQPLLCLRLAVNLPIDNGSWRMPSFGHNVEIKPDSSAAAVVIQWSRYINRNCRFFREPIV